DRLPRRGPGTRIRAVRGASARGRHRMAVSHEPNPSAIRRYRSTTDLAAGTLIGVSESSGRAEPGASGFVYIGCYTKGSGGDGAGITRARREPSGALTDATVVAST